MDPLSSPGIIVDDFLRNLSQIIEKLIFGLSRSRFWLSERPFIGFKRFVHSVEPHCWDLFGVCVCVFVCFHCGVLFWIVCIVLIVGIALDFVWSVLDCLGLIGL